MLGITDEESADEWSQDHSEKNENPVVNDRNLHLCFRNFWFGRPIPDSDESLIVAFHSALACSGLDGHKETCETDTESTAAVLKELELSPLIFLLQRRQRRSKHRTMTTTTSMSIDSSSCDEFNDKDPMAMKCSMILCSPLLFEIHLSILQRLLAASSRHAYTISAEMRQAQSDANSKDNNNKNTTTSTTSGLLTGNASVDNNNKSVLLSHDQCTSALLVQEAACYQVLLNAFVPFLDVNYSANNTKNNQLDGNTNESMLLLFRALHAAS